MKQNNEYKVLARKYRPKNFKDLVGQELLVEILSNAIINERLAHAYVLTGVRGVGKTTTARIIALSINCQKREKNIYEPCGQCDSCKSIGVDSNLDVIEMDAASNTGVDDVREIIDNIKYKPILGKYKIFIIDEVHMLSKNAFNALLKTLEEPPEHVKFIFATTEVKKIPITVLSRCQRFDLLRINNQNLTNHLLKIIKLESIDIEMEAISLIVRASDGSIRDALSLLDQAISNQNEKINANTIVRMLGLAERDKIFDLIESILKGETSEALNMYKKLYELGADVTMIFDDLLNVVHLLTQIKLAPEIKNDIYVPENERIRGAQLSDNLSLNNINIIWQILFKGFQELQSGIHPFQHGEMIILRIIYLFDGSDPNDLLEKLTKGNVAKKTNDIKKNNLEVADKETTQKLEINKNTNDLKTNTSDDSLSIKNFRQFVEMFFKNREGLLHTKLYNDVSLISFKEGEIVINIDNIRDSTFTRSVAKLISKWTGRIWQIHTSSSNMGKTLSEEDTIMQQEDIEVLKNHPDVKKILDEFPGSKIHSITNLTEVNTDVNNIKLTLEKEK